MKILNITLMLFVLSTIMKAQTPSRVDYDAFEKLVEEVKDHRQERLITLNEFNKMSQQENTIILDTRSKEMYEAKHVKGAKHLNFSDFTQDNLAKIIPNKETRVLIYCNNNIEDDAIHFADKAAAPAPELNRKELTLALNIPTYLNLYGYGYDNVYELSEMVSVFDTDIEFDGTYQVLDQ